MIQHLVPGSFSAELPDMKANHFIASCLVANGYRKSFTAWSRKIGAAVHRIQAVGNQGSGRTCRRSGMFEQWLLQIIRNHERTRPQNAVAVRLDYIVEGTEVRRYI